MIPVTSSNIEAIGYDAPTRTMHVAFKSGHAYAVHSVGAEEHQRFLGAKSKGEHFHRFFRNGPKRRIVRLEER